MTGFSFQGGARLIFVGGAPRSGTTLMQNMLDSHPEIAGGPEFDHIPDIVNMRTLLHKAIDRGRISVFVDKNYVDGEIGFFVERLLFPYLARHNKRLLSEKTPANVLHFRRLLEIFPASHCVFCLRDPRAVLSSLLQVGKRGKKMGKTPKFTRNFWSAVKLINSYNDAGFDALESSERVLLVRYENLVTQPEQEMGRLCEYLGVSYSEAMLHSGEKKHDGDATLDDVWYTKEMYYSNPDPVRAEKWRRELTPFQQALASLLFSSDSRLVAQGYDFSNDDIPVTQRLLAKLVFNVRRLWILRGKQLANKGTYATNLASGFDRLSESYDKKMASFNYLAPQLLFSAMEELVHEKTDKLAILDAGCGTGLCGELFRPLAHQLDGVDLSLGMVEKARQRGFYDHLAYSD